MALNRRSTVLREADWSGVKWIVASPPGYLIQILVPLYDNDGHRFPEELYVRLHTELMERFGGLTAHVRSPARGLWTTGEGELTRDDVAIVEVMTDRLDRSWWRTYRSVLEERFRQEEMLVRAADGAVVGSSGFATAGRPVRLRCARGRRYNPSFGSTADGRRGVPDVGG